MGAFFIQFMGTAMSKSIQALENVRDEAAAEAIMEQIVADYVFEINKSDPLSALGAMIAKNLSNTYGPGVTMNILLSTPAALSKPLL